MTTAAAPATDAPLPTPTEAAAAARRAQILAALTKHDGNRTRAAAELHISTQALYWHMKRLGLAADAPAARAGRPWKRAAAEAPVAERVSRKTPTKKASAKKAQNGR